ncbi:16S rRNA (cytosine(1402)-N(4))-methyltransferase RsmH [Tundrisphaera lichenicola]|uniref:16S rRNA (cytosine(1402)-N(4))-methyltransferase RsmH n=1 Tax=Tundrisphaera lichenicola TaxID=2029860 RepID=UPI003EB7696B
MTGPDPNKPARRPRYRGKNPRRFDQKYKEHQPDRYSEAVAKVVAGGKTPAGSHRPIMVREILEVLAPGPGQIAVDATLGHGGHARELLAGVQPGGRLLGLDADPIELPRTEARLIALGFPIGSVVVRRMNFAGVAPFVLGEEPGGADLILADLGVSSMQLDDPARGFTFKADGPLDMRMNPSRGRPASEFLSSLGVQGLAKILAENADEPQPSEIARCILSAHDRKPLATTRELAQAIRSAFARPNDPTTDSAVRRVFQAIRIAVNDEFASLDAFLHGLPTCLKPGGRVAILSFHSGEDRRVKAAFKDGLISGVYASTSNEVIRASAEERRANPRSTSAKLRYAVRA